MKITRQFFITYLDDERYKTMEERQKRSLTMQKLAVDLIFYLILVWFGFYVLGNTDFLSSYFFGVGKCENLFRNYPEPLPTLYLKEYYLI